MTLGLHIDPTLDRARAAAERALRDRLAEAGWPAEVADGLAQVAAEVAVNAAWASLKREVRRPMQDGRTIPHQEGAR